MSVQWINAGIRVQYGASPFGPWSGDPWDYPNGYVGIGWFSADVPGAPRAAYNALLGKVVRGYRVAGTTKGRHYGTSLQVVPAAPAMEAGGSYTSGPIIAVPRGTTVSAEDNDLTRAARKFYGESTRLGRPLALGEHVLTALGGKNVLSFGVLQWNGPAPPGDPPRVVLTVNDLAFSDRPAATITMSKAKISGTDTAQCRVSLQYPGGNDPVTDVTVEITADAGCEVAAPYAAFGPVATTVVDDHGAAVFTVRGVSTGIATVRVRLKDDNPNWLQLEPMFVNAWPLTASITVEAPTEAPKPGTCTTYPAVPGVPRVPATYSTEKTYSWDAGANSVLELDGDVRLEFVQPHAVGVVLGLTGTRDAVGSYARMTHAFYFHYDPMARPVYQVMEGGEPASHASVHDAATVFAIERVGGVVSYYVDDALVYRSLAPSSGTVLAGCALYSSGDQVPA